MSVKVMVIDDETMITSILSFVIEENITENVEVFNDAATALAKLMQEKYDFISLDHQMPKMTGSTLLKLLRSTPGPNQKTPVLMFTSYIEDVKREGMEVYENVLFLSKPIDNERYIRNVKFALQMNKVLVEPQIDM